MEIKSGCSINASKLHRLILVFNVAAVKNKTFTQGIQSN